MPNKLIKDLIDKGAVTLKEQGYSIRSREYTLLTWKQFQEFCNKKGYETYLPSHKDEFITELGKCTPPLRQSTIDRKAGSMKMLDLLATKGTWGKGMLNPLQELLPEFNSFLDAQEEYLIKTGYSECTRETMRNYISVVMRYFQNAGINKYAKAASVIDPSIPEKIPPHLMRHTKAMHIYDADNDLVHVRDFLGHSDIKTTDIYARSSLTMKQKALERVSDSPVPSMPSWQKSRSTMEWLKSFGSQKA